MSALLDSLAASFCGSNARRELLDAALQTGLPAARNEAWKYTSLRQLERRSFSAAPLQAPTIDPALLAGIPTPRLVFANGRASDAHSDLAGLDAGVQVRLLSAIAEDAPETTPYLQRRFDRAEEVFAQLNAALADEGVLIEVGEGVASATPLHLVFVNTADGSDRAWHHLHSVALHRDASLQLVEHHLQGSDNANFDNTLVQVQLAQGAQLAHARMQVDAARATCLLRTDATLARDAHYRRIDLELGATLSRHELNVRLEGDNAKLTANGVLLGSGRRHIDTRLGIEHVARDTSAGAAS